MTTRAGRGSLHGRPAIALALLATACAGPVAQAAVTCTVTAGAVPFGVYDPLSATPDDITSTIRLQCSATGQLERVRSRIALSAGAGGSFAPRRLFSGSYTLNYNLFTNAARTTIWGDGSAGTSTVAANLNVPANATRTASRTVYGRIPALQTPGAGAFVDTIVVTVTY